MLFRMSPFYRCLLLLLLSLLIQSCGGGGSGGTTPSNSPQTLPPKVLKATSYENKTLSDIPPQLTQLPRLSATSGIVSGWDAGVTTMPTSLAIADFQQNGSYSAFLVASDGLTKSQAVFVGYSATGYVDLTATLLPAGTDRTACVLPQQAAVADLNKDGRPDVYVACAGVAGAAVTQVIFFSRADGTYEKAPASTWPSQLNASSVALADIDNGTDKCVDVVTTDNGSLKIFKASCSGGYSLVEEPNRRPTALPSNILSVFLVPDVTATTRYDLLVGADATNQPYPFKWFANSGSGYFDNTSNRQYALQWGGASNRYDYLVDGSYGYIYITNSLDQTFVKLARIVLPAANSNTTPSYYTPANTVTPVNDWPSYLRVRDGYLEPYDAGCGKSISTDDSTRCGKRYPMYPLTGFVP